MLCSLAKVSGMERSDLFKRETGIQLSLMSKECGGWVGASHRMSVFCALMVESGSAVGYYPDLVVDIFQSVLSKSAAGGSAKDMDHEIQLRIFIVMSKQLYNVDSTLNSQNQFASYSLKILSSEIQVANTVF